MSKKCILKLHHCLSSWYQIWESNLVKHEQSNLYCQLMQKRCSILKEVVAKGRPKLTFEQPKLKLPDHPEIQQFLRNVQQTFVYQNFSNRNRNQARHWADKYSNKQFGSYLSDKYSEQKKREYCCDAKPSGVGKNA